MYINVFVAFREQKALYLAVFRGKLEPNTSNTTFPLASGICSSQIIYQTHALLL